MMPHDRNSPNGQVNPFGRVFTVRELAELWQLSENSVRRLLADEAGVFCLNSKHRGRRNYATLRIPLEVAMRVWRPRGGQIGRPDAA
jgi:hypothetical protein